MLVVIFFSILCVVGTGLLITFLIKKIYDERLLIPMIMFIIALVIGMVGIYKTEINQLEIKENHRLPDRIFIIDENNKEHFFTDVRSYKMVMTNVYVEHTVEKSLFGISIDIDYKLKEKE